MKSIISYPEPILRRSANKVEVVDKNLKDKIEALKQTLLECEIGAGLAAPQIGISDKFFGIKEGETKEVKIFINPKIVKTWGKRNFAKIILKDGKEEDFLEGCLSFADYYGTVKRFLDIEAEWQELVNGKLEKKRKKLSGFEAIVYQHESDHLEGVLFVDHIKKDGGKFYKQVKGKMIEWDLDEVIKGNL